MGDRDFHENHEILALCGLHVQRQKSHQNSPKTPTSHQGKFWPTIFDTFRTTRRQKPHFCWLSILPCSSCSPGEAHFVDFLICCSKGLRQYGLSRVADQSRSASSISHGAQRRPFAAMYHIGAPFCLEHKAPLSRPMLRSICSAAFGAPCRENSGASKTASPSPVHSEEVDGGYQCLVEA